MPDDPIQPGDPAPGDKAAAIEAELQAKINDAKADVAADAAHSEQRRADEERLANLEHRLNEMESRSGAAPIMSAPAAPAPPADDGKVAALTAQVAELTSKITEPVADAAANVTEPLGAAAEEIEDVVENAPVRTHGMFRKLWGGHD